MRPLRTAAELSATVAIGVTTESLYLEFKREAPGPLPKGVKQGVINSAQMELVADIIQFANANGGSILYGIEEGAGPTPGLKIATDIVPIQKPDELRQWIEQAIRNYAVPATFSRDVVAIDTDKGIVIAVNVPQCRYLVSVWDSDQHTVKYPKRTSHGLDWMNPDEAERHLMDGSRAARIALIDACSGATQSIDGYAVELIDGFCIGATNSTVRTRHAFANTQTFIKLDDYSFHLKVIMRGGHHSFSLPYGVVKQAWRTSANGAGLILDVVFVVPQTSTGPQIPMWIESRS